MSDMSCRLVVAMGVAALSPAALAGPRLLSVEAISVAARNCGVEGVAIRREGRRTFSVTQDPKTSVTRVTVEPGPLSAERERELEAAAAAGMRSWNCLVRWGRSRGVSIRWGIHEQVIYD